jgi:deoxyribonuclease V
VTGPGSTRPEPAWRAPRDAAAAERAQVVVAGRVRVPTGPVAAPTTVAGLDVSYAKGSDRVVAAAVVVDATTGAVVEEALADGTAEFPYVPGLLAFREVPMLLRVLDRLTTQVDLLLCDGQGLAHPRRCGGRLPPRRADRAAGRRLREEPPGRRAPRTRPAAR